MSQIVRADLPRYEVPPEGTKIYYVDNDGTLFEGVVVGKDITFEGYKEVVTVADYLEHPYLKFIQPSLATAFRNNSRNVLKEMLEFEQGEGANIEGAMALFRTKFPNGIRRGGRRKSRSKSKRKSKSRKSRR
jgi:hypothetical protein